MTARRLVHLLLLVASVPASAATSPELAPYAAYASGSDGARLLQVAREALCAAAGRCDTLRATAPDWPAAPRPVFVTLARGRVTRACLGSDEPHGTLAETVRAIAAGLLTGDRRRMPVRAEELDSLRVLVAFAGDATALGDPHTVNPMREGLRIESERGAVVFLPGEARTVSWALAEARRLGVLVSSADARFSRFDAIVISGPPMPPRLRSPSHTATEAHP